MEASCVTGAVPLVAHRGGRRAPTSRLALCTHQALCAHVAGWERPPRPGRCRTLHRHARLRSGARPEARCFRGRVLCRAALKAPASAVDDLTPLVESAMLAACTGLAYHFSASFRLESYLGALFPFPVVLSAARWGCDAAWKTLVTTSLLLLLLGGPLRAATYILLHGSLGMATCVLWSQKRHWLLSVPAAALVRSAGVFASLMVSSLMLRENVLALIISQVCAMVDHMLATVGAGGSPELVWAYVAAVVLVVVNSLSYCLLLHLLYTLLLARVDCKPFGNPPTLVRRAFLFSER